MKIKLESSLSKSLVLIVCMFFFSALNVQAQGPGNDGNPNQPSNCGNCQGNSGVGDGNKGNAVPIDGGASLLLAAGAMYGIKKFRDYRIEKNEKEPLM